jgi:hypothetical protein
VKEKRGEEKNERIQDNRRENDKKAAVNKNQNKR